MATQYTPILQLALPVTGELNGTWGDVVNDNITSMVEEAIAGLATISTWTANSHTLTTVDGLTDEARCAMIVAQTGAGGTALTAAGNIICPARTKLYVVSNQSTYQVTIKTAAGTGVAVAAGDTTFVFCDGTNVLACVTQIVNGHITGNLTVDGNATVNGNTTLGDSSADTVVINAGSTTINDGGAIRFEDNAGGEYVAIKAPATVTATYTLTLPVDDGTSGQALVTDGSGNLAWSTAASGDVYGPASSTDTAVALFDGTTGKLIKNSTVTVASDGATVIAANSTSDGLRITQLGTGNALTVEDSANPDSTPFVVTQFGRVLAGSNTAVSYGSDGSQFLQVNGIYGWGTSRWSNDTAGSYSSIAKSRSATIGTYSIVSSGDSIGGINYFGDDGVGFIKAAAIDAYVDGTPGSNDMPGRLVFSTTADGAASPTERMRINSAGAVGIGSASLTGYMLRGAGNLTGSASSRAVDWSPAIQSDVTSTAYVFSSVPTVQDAAFTLANLGHFRATQGTKGASATITNQLGFYAEGTLTGATNNYGFYSNIASGTGRWNFYAAGSADNYFAGDCLLGSATPSTGSPKLSVVDSSGICIGISNTALDAINKSAMIVNRSYTNANPDWALVYGQGQTAANIANFGGGSSAVNAASELRFWTAADNNTLTGTERMRIDNYGSVGIGGAAGAAYTMYLLKNPTGATATYGLRNGGTIQSDVTSQHNVFYSRPATAASAFTVSGLYHYRATRGTFGAGSAVTTQYGFVVDSDLTGATTNYGFYSNIASGTGRWNFYAAGSADNYFAGNTGFGGVTPTTFITLNAAGQANGIAGVSGSTYLWGLTRNASNGVAIDAYGDITFVTNSASGSKTGTERMRIDSSGNVIVTGAGGLGYGTGSGGAVTQGTSRTTGVTLNKTNGAITLVSAAGSATYQSFTVTNSTVAATDVVHVCQKSGTDNYIILVTNVAAGSFAITFATTGGTTTEQPVFNFAVIKAVTA